MRAHPDRLVEVEDAPHRERGVLSRAERLADEGELLLGCHAIEVHDVREQDRDRRAMRDMAPAAQRKRHRVHVAEPRVAEGKGRRDDRPHHPLARLEV